MPKYVLEFRGVAAGAGGTASPLLIGRGAPVRFPLDNHPPPLTNCVQAKETVTTNL